MFNQELADKIVEYLNSCFPDKVQFDDLRAALSEFSALPEDEWLRVLDALEQDGRVDFKGIRTGFDNTLQMVANIVVSNTERRRLAQTPAVPVVHSPTPTDPERAKHVWVVLGRDSRANSAIFTLLLAFGLKPVSFGKARELTGKPMPHISEILRAAFLHAQAVLVLLTPDDLGKLRPEFVKSEDEPSDTDLTPQPRLNVIFEAGMAVVSHPEQTIFVRFGYVRPFSDVAGLHYVSMDGTVDSRRELGLRLRQAGCPADLDGDQWLHAGDFVQTGKTVVPAHANNVLRSEIAAYAASLQMEWEGQKKHRPVLLSPLWNIIDRACPRLLEMHTQALAKGDEDIAGKLAECYQALKKYEGAAERATMDFDEAAFIADVDDAIARLKSGVKTGISTA